MIYVDLSMEPGNLRFPHGFEIKLSDHKASGEPVLTYGISGASLSEKLKEWLQENIGEDDWQWSHLAVYDFGQPIMIRLDFSHLDDATHFRLVWG